MINVTGRIGSVVGLRSSLSGAINAGSGDFAGRDLAGFGISGTSYGEFGALAGAGISESNVVANSIGAVTGVSAGGVGIETTKLVSRTGGIASVSGTGWLDGLSGLTVVAHTDIGPITGIAKVDGSGINGGSFDANYGSIGQITAEGGAAGGHGIVSTRFQATDLDEEEAGNGRIAGLSASANANGRNALTDVLVYAGSIGAISATVHGGLDGNGIGIIDGKVQASGDIGGMTVKAFNATAIQGGTFQSRGNFGSIYAEATKGGNAIDGAVLTAPGRIVRSAFTARTAVYDGRGNFDNTGTIGDVLVRNRSSAQPGLGTGIESSSFLAGAAGGIGALTIQGRTLGAVFIISGQPVVMAAAAAGPVGAPPTAIGPVTVSMANSMDLTLDAAGGDIGAIAFTNLASGAVITLTLPKGLPSLAQMGAFSAGSLPGLSRDVSIGSRSLRGTSIGAIQIGAINRTRQQKGLYNFAFPTYAGSPNAVVGSSGRNATSKGATVDAVRLFKTAAAQPAPTTTPAKKKKR